MIEAFRKSAGYVVFTAVGGCAERFFTACCENGVKLWNITARKDRYTACVRAKNYRKLRKYARNYRVKIRVSQKVGTPFFVAKHRYRVGIPIGLGVFIALLWVLSQFVWEIKISGNTDLTQAQLLYALERCGVYESAPISSISADSVKLRLMLENSDIAWAALNRRGTTVYLELAERVLQPDALPLSHPCNVVAEYTGRVIKCRCYTGVPSVRAGEGVAAGQLLISGIVTDREGAVSFVHATGSVLAEVSIVKSVSVPKTVKTAVPSENGKTVYDLCFFGLRLPLYFKGGEYNEFTVESESKLRIFGNCYPFSVRKTVFFDKTVTETELTDEEIEAQYLTLLADYEGAELANAQINGRQLAVTPTEDSVIVTAVYDCVMEIGIEREFYTQ